MDPVGPIRCLCLTRCQWIWFSLCWGMTAHQCSIGHIAQKLLLKGKMRWEKYELFEIQVAMSWNCKYDVRVTIKESSVRLQKRRNLFQRERFLINYLIVIQSL